MHVQGALATEGRFATDAGVNAVDATEGTWPHNLSDLIHSKQDLTKSPQQSLACWDNTLIYSVQLVRVSLKETLERRDHRERLPLCPIRRRICSSTTERNATALGENVSICMSIEAPGSPCEGIVELLPPGRIAAQILVQAR